MRKIFSFLIGLLAVVTAHAGTFSLFSPATGVLKGNSSTYVTSAATASDIIGLFSVCSGIQYLGADGACHTAGSGTFGADSLSTWNSSTADLSLGSLATPSVIHGADGPPFTAGANLTIRAGLGASNDGGAMLMKSGDGGGGAGIAGALTLQAGTGTVNGAGGNVTLKAGNTQISGTGPAAGGTINITGGNADQGTPGGVTITTGTNAVAAGSSFVVNTGGSDRLTITGAGAMNVTAASVALPTSTQINSKSVCLADGTNCPAAGSVTSVALTAPAIFSVAGSPVTTSGTLAISATGTSGGVPYFDSSTTLASSAALTNHALVLGGGAAASPTVLGSLGTTTTLLHGNAAGAPSFGAVSLTADVSGTLPVASGGTGAGTLTSHGVLIGAGTSAVTAVAAMSADTLLQGQGASADPAAVAVTNCGDSTHALAYSTSTHTFSCQAITGSGGSPGGANTNVQYNNSAAFGGDATFTFNSATKALSATTVYVNSKAATTSDGSTKMRIVSCAAQGSGSVLGSNDGCASNTHNGTGDITVAFSTAFSAAPVCNVTSQGSGGNLSKIDASNPTTTQVRVITVTASTGAAADAGNVHIICIGQN